MTVKLSQTETISSLEQNVAAI